MANLMKFYEKGDPSITENILRSLPDWFGIEQAIVAYINKSKELPMIVAYRDNSPIGFISIKSHSTYTAEIYVMGILPQYHRSGVGKDLLKETEKYLNKYRFEFLQVKTLDESRESDFYKKTRLFYKSMGFKEVEVLANLWGKDNPCLLLIKNVRATKNKKVPPYFSSVLKVGWHLLDNL